MAANTWGWGRGVKGAAEYHCYAMKILSKCHFLPLQKPLKIEQHYQAGLADHHHLPPEGLEYQQCQAPGSAMPADLEMTCWTAQMSMSGPGQLCLQAINLHHFSALTRATFCA